MLAHSAVLALEFVLLAGVSDPTPAPRPNVIQLARAWWREVRASVAVFAWRQPFHSQREPDDVDAHRHAGRCGVVLVHGFVCNRGLWTPWLARLRRRGTPFVAVNLEPVFGAIDGYVPLIEAAVQRLEQATGVPPVLVAHSMGGLAIRAWSRSCEGDTRLRAMMTLGSPHQGTWLARFAFSPNGRQMRRGSQWLTALAAHELVRPPAQHLCFYSHCDNIVHPAATATLPYADNRHLPGVAHVDMVHQSQAYEALEVWLSRADDESAQRGLTRPVR
ncbi:alpha/beta fold hydrolase [Ideonella sp. A 288]|uniref:alpha/beta fold hydrolase n=1 Tax=Ideonella sp. A 288 TaxID=1962181 RepID=UPI001F348A0E|nr:alpha/beta fold hydrolase [Ideonella sp. A 288]